MMFTIRWIEDGGTQITSARNDGFKFPRFWRRINKWGGLDVLKTAPLFYSHNKYYDK